VKYLKKNQSNLSSLHIVLRNENETLKSNYEYLGEKYSKTMMMVNNQLAPYSVLNEKGDCELVPMQSPLCWQCRKDNRKLSSQNSPLPKP